MWKRTSTKTKIVHLKHVAQSMWLARDKCPLYLSCLYYCNFVCFVKIFNNSEGNASLQMALRPSKHSVSQLPVSYSHRAPVTAHLMSVVGPIPSQPAAS